MAVELIGSLAAGLGLFFVGVTLVSTNLKKMASRRLRLAFARLANRDWKAALVGAVSGFVTQSTSVAAFVVAGLISSGLMNVRNALPIVFWANAGCSILVVIAVLDIQVAVFFLLFVSGLVFAFERPYRFRYLGRALFGVGLLFLGLQMIRAGATPLAGTPLVEDLLRQVSGSNLLAFALGAILTILTQTALGVILIAIAMTNTGLFTVDQTIMLIYGAHLGSSALTWLLASGVKGTARQLVMAQVLFNIFGVAMMTTLFYLEYWGGLPLVKALISRLNPAVDQQMAYLVVLFNLLVPLLTSFAYNPLHRFLHRLWPPTTEEDLSKTRYIQSTLPGQNLDFPEASLVLIDQEIQRLLKRLPAYLEGLRAGLEDRPSAASASHSQPTPATPPPPSAVVYHQAFLAIHDEILAVLRELAQQDLTPETSARMLHCQHCANQLAALEESVHAFAQVGAGEKGEESLRRFFQVLLESLDFMLLTAVEAVAARAAGDDEPLATLIALTADQGRAMSRIRDRYLEAAATLAFADKASLYTASTTVERLVWSLHRYALLLREG